MHRSNGSWYLQYNTSENILGQCLLQFTSHTCIKVANVQKSHYRQHGVQRNATVFNLLRGQFLGFSSSRGDTLHRWGWNLAQRRVHAKFHPHRCNNKSIGPQNWNFYWDLIKMWNMNAMQGYIPCAIFTKFAEFVPRFRTRYVLKFSWICSRGYGVMAVLSWWGLVIPKFSVSPSGETMHQTPKSFTGARTSLRSSITMPSLVGFAFHPPPEWSKT